MVTALTEEADQVIAQMARRGVMRARGFEQRRGTLADLYHKLSLVLMTARNDVEGEVKRIRKGRRALETYRRGLGQT
jgi:hypothetical protein